MTAKGNTPSTRKAQMRSRRGAQLLRSAALDLPVAVTKLRSQVRS